MFWFTGCVPDVSFDGTTVTVVVSDVTDVVLVESFVGIGINVVAAGVIVDNSSVTVTVSVCSEGCILVVVFSTDEVYVSVWESLVVSVDCKVVFSSKVVLLKLMVVVFSFAESVTTEGY